MTTPNKYNQRGVSADKEDVHKAIAQLDKGLFPKAFCKIVPDYLGNDENYCVVMHADGAGTKSSLAYIYWKETGDISVWRGIAQDAVVMNTDDLLCVGALDNILLSSTIGRNKFLIPGQEHKIIYLLGFSSLMRFKIKEEKINVDLKLPKNGIAKILEFIVGIFFSKKYSRLNPVLFTTLFK